MVVSSQPNGPTTTSTDIVGKLKDLHAQIEDDGSEEKLSTNVSFFRLMPPFLIVFVIYIYIMPYWGSGPLWMAREFPIKNEDCHNYWWAFVILLNNFIPDWRGSNVS